MKYCGRVGQAGFVDCDPEYGQCDICLIKRLKAEYARSTEREILQLAEIEALRREREGKVLCDRDLFETLRDSANTEADEHRQCMATYRPLRQASLDSVVKKCDDLLAALGQELGPSKEIIWCACGDGYPVNSYGAGLMDANEGVCANCDAANQGVEPDLDTLRKDAKRYRWLRRAGNTKAIALVAEHCLDALDEAIDAATGQGEQS